MGKNFCVETSTAAELYQAPEVIFASDSLSNKRPRSPADLPIGDVIVPFSDVRPELSLFVHHFPSSYSPKAASRVAA
jgi:hypothetical protein